MLRSGTPETPPLSTVSQISEKALTDSRSRQGHHPRGNPGPDHFLACGLHHNPSLLVEIPRLASVAKAKKGYRIIRSRWKIFLLVILEGGVQAAVEHKRPQGKPYYNSFVW